jgi:L-ascorbate metabolism protein UlaG (beta-lactamase superfamily)
MTSSFAYNGVKITWITHACFLLEARGRKIYFDPYNLPPGLPPADGVFVSHDHFDHCDATTIGRICARDTKIVCPAKAALKLQPLRSKLQVIAEGDAPSVYGFYCKVVAAYNTNKKFHPRGAGVGYIVTIDGKNFYHAGDTDFTPEMAKLQNIDVAMLPAGGTYTMDIGECAAAANAFKPKILIPMHYRSLEGLAMDASGISATLDKSIRLEILEPLGS